MKKISFNKIAWDLLDANGNPVVEGVIEGRNISDWVYYHIYLTKKLDASSTYYGLFIKLGKLTSKTEASVGAPLYNYFTKLPAAIIKRGVIFNSFKGTLDLSLNLAN